MASSEREMIGDGDLCRAGTFLGLFEGGLEREAEILPEAAGLVPEAIGGAGKTEAGVVEDSELSGACSTLDSDADSSAAE